MSDQERTPQSQDANGDQDDEMSYGHDHPSSPTNRRRSRSRSEHKRTRSRSRTPRRKYSSRHRNTRSRSRSRTRRYNRDSPPLRTSPGRGGDYRRHYDNYNGGSHGTSNGYGGSLGSSFRGGFGDSRYDDSHRRGGAGGRGGGYSSSYSNSHSSHRGGGGRRGGGGGGGGVVDRENPPISRCLGVFGLSIYTQERDLKHVFGQFGTITDVQIVFDAQTGRSRGFAFVYFDTIDDAKLAKDKCNGIDIDGRKIRVDFSVTQRPHTPTPGVYMGRPHQSRGRGGSNYHSHNSNGSHRHTGHDYSESRGYKDRSLSPHYKEKRSRYSRSRSYSPRKTSFNDNYLRLPASNHHLNKNYRFESFKRL